VTADAKLRFATLALRRDLPSDYVELAPVVSPAIVAYNEPDRARAELQLALSELPSETRPATVARLLLPAGVRVERVAVAIARGDRPGRLARAQKIEVHVALVPEPREDGAIAGHWAFVPVFDHACFVARNEDLEERLAAELGALPVALNFELDAWRRALTYARTALEPIDVELSTTPLAQAKGRRALADIERKRLAYATLDAAGRRVQPADPAPPLVGRTAQLAELARALDARASRSVLVVGDEAAGKSALVHAWCAANPAREVWATSASELVAGASGFGEWQQRVAAVLDAAATLGAILYFDDFGAVFADRPEQGGVELGAALRRHVVDGRVRVIGELTPTALDRAERRDVSLVGAMLRVTVPATDHATTVAACAAWADYWRRTQPHRPQLAAPTVPAAVELARRFLPYRALPGKAVRLLEELRVAHDAGRDARGAGPVLEPDMLYASFSWSTGIPTALLDDRQPLARDAVIAALRRRMIGQDAAVARVADAICVAKARLQPADKPLASLFFVGPTGTGKTELARSVAAYLFGAPDKMVRLDMSEYTDPWAAERLFGGGPDADGRLTSAVRSQPFGVVLLDEIEKAHPSVFDLLLQVLGEARLTDGRGRTTYFHNAIVVLTSNLGTRSAKGSLGLRPSALDNDREERRYRDAVLAAFRPELVNRLDQIVVFHPLAADQIAAIAGIAIARLGERRGLAQTGAILDISPAAIARLAEHGFSPDLGARALRRYLDDALVAPIARLVAKAGADGHGGTISVRAPGEEQLDDPGSKLGEHAGDVTIALRRRATSTGRRLVRGALALGELRRDSDRELALRPSRAVVDRLGELASTLATAARKVDGKAKLPGAEIARLSTEHARLQARLEACTTPLGELRTAEELCLEALAKDIDAVDLVDGALAQRRAFRAALFWLVTATRDSKPGATLLVHSPDSRLAVVAWTKLVLAAAEAHGFRASVHAWTDPKWSPARDRAWLDDNTPGALLVRVAGSGTNLLFGLEAGLHKFVGLAGDPCHVWVDALEQKSEFSDKEWEQLPPPPIPVPARGAAMREIDVPGDRVLVSGDEIEVPWSELAARLPEAAVVRVLAALADEDADDGALWKWSHPLAVLELAEAAKK
jgi:ATP-dependent Clp protease ATP-binding subunit ClpC